MMEAELIINGGGRPLYISAIHRDHGDWFTGEGVSFEARRKGRGWVYRHRRWGERPGRWLTTTDRWMRFAISP